MSEQTMAAGFAASFVSYGIDRAVLLRDAGLRENDLAN